MSTPTIVVLKEGTDTSQGKGQTISNINACIAVQEILRPTLGPMGSDVLVVDAKGKSTISNDGATILNLLDVVHPAARLVVDISKSQDAEVGDGTSSVTILAGELLREAKQFVEENVSPNTIIRGYRKAVQLAVDHIQKIAVAIDKSHESELRQLLQRCAATAMSSKIVSKNSEFFTKMVVDAIFSLDQDILNERLIGIKKVAGGGIEDSLFIDGTAFKKTFSYAGFEQQPKKFIDPKIVLLDVELELKAERDNAEVRIDKVSEYQAIVDAEWEIILDKLEALRSTGAQIVLSKMPIGDLATQYFADRDIFCAGRVTSEDMHRLAEATGAQIQNTCTNILPEHLGTCGVFEERQIGGERFNLFTQCPKAKTCTLVLRGGADQFIDEVARSLHDAIMVVKRALQTNEVVAGGGACEMAVSKYLRDYSLTIPGKEQLVIGAFARAMEVIPRQLCENAGFDGIDILNMLRMKHHMGEQWTGVDFRSGSIADNFKNFVWEPALVKVNALQSATEAACIVLSVDETVKSKTASNDANPQMNPQMQMPR